MSTASAAYGTFLYPSIPFLQQGAAIGTPFGTLLAPATRVAAYVRSGGPADGDDESLRSMLVTSLKDALRHVRSGRGDTIVVLPGHSEDVTDGTFMDNLVAGTRIIGMGDGASMPVFRWTAAASKWTIDDDGVVIQGLRLLVGGETTDLVAYPIQVSADDCAIIGCDIRTGVSNTQRAYLAVRADTGADRFRFIGNRVRNEGGANTTLGLSLRSGGDGHVVMGNISVGAFVTSNFEVGAAETGLLIADNILHNLDTAATAALSFGDFATTGIVARNAIGISKDGVAASGGITFGGANPAVRCVENYNSDEPQKSGVLAPAAVAT